MSQYRTYFFVSEQQISGDGNPMELIETGLPHHDFIGQEICRSWNEAHIEQFFYGILKDRIRSCKMTCRLDNKGHTCCHICFTGVDGFRMTKKVKDAIDEQVTGQFCDGWGEGFFGITMEAPDGAKLQVF